MLIQRCYSLRIQPSQWNQRPNQQFCSSFVDESTVNSRLYPQRIGMQVINHPFTKDPHPFSHFMYKINKQTYFHSHILSPLIIVIVVYDQRKNCMVFISCLLILRSIKRILARLCLSSTLYLSLTQILAFQLFL